METIRNIAAALCGALVVTAIFAMLTPSAGMNRFVKLAVRLFFLLCIVAPFARGEVNLNLDTSRYFSAGETVKTDLSTLAEKQLLEAFSQNVETGVSGILQKHGITAEKIQIDAHIEEEQRIEFTTIEITLEQESGELGDALSEIRTSYGVEASVLYNRDAE